MRGTYIPSRVSKKHLSYVSVEEAKGSLPDLNNVPKSMFTNYNKAKVYDSLKSSRKMTRREPKEAWADSSEEESSIGNGTGRGHIYDSTSEDEFSVESAGTDNSSPSLRKSFLTPLKGAKSPGSPDLLTGWSSKSRVHARKPQLFGLEYRLGTTSSPDTSLSASMVTNTSMTSLSPVSGIKQDTSWGSPLSPQKHSMLSSIGFILPAGATAPPDQQRGRSLIREDDASGEEAEADGFRFKVFSGHRDKRSPDKDRYTKKKKRDRSPQRLMKDRLRKLTESLESVSEEQTGLRSMLLSEADKMVSELPLRYLASKPELRHYAMERAGRPVIRHMMNVLRAKMRWALDRWKTNYPPNQALDERQVAFLVIADRLEKMIYPIYRGAFDLWASQYSSRYQIQLGVRREAAAGDIQNWYRHIRITKRKLFKFFTDAVKVCLDRRKAIKHMVLFESKRRSALLKFQRTIGYRRRVWFAARSITRPYLWFKLYRKVQTRLTRRINVRWIQRWFRMTRYRPAKELYLIRNILRYGGYSRVIVKMPEDLLRRNGLLLGFEQCASRIQRAWFVSKGNFAAFMVAAARRAKEEYQQMLNDNATIIQQNFRGHLWNLLNTAAIQHNRARRMSFAFRHYQYRVWVAKKIAPRVHRPARRIQKFCRLQMWKAHLKVRFKMRKVTKIWFNLRRTLAANSIQREYRAHIERERIKHEEFLKWVAEQRKNAEKMSNSIKFIQLAWRKKLRKNRFPRHIYLVSWRIVREHRSNLHRNAIIIQQRARRYVEVMRAIWKAERIRCANVIWVLAKCYLLKLAVFDRVQATRLIQTAASNLIKKNFRIFLYLGRLDLRCKIKRAQRLYSHFIWRTATYLQRWIKRKFVEYYLPVRTSARASLKKRRRDEEARRVLNIENKAAGFLQRFFRCHAVRWTPQIELIARERHRCLRIYKARCLQKFGRYIIAWQRFEKVAAYKKRIKLEMLLLEQQRQAANIIGYYYKRKLEKFELNARFKNRRWMIDEFNRLDAERVEAERVRDIAIEDKRRTDENMQATINASWKQGSDVNGRNYYYNYVTGESSWEVPEHFKVPVAINKWLKQLDDRQNVYYYNMQTQESSWLPPCTICGDQSEKWCQECDTAYCDRHFDEAHCLDEEPSEENKEIREHKWSLVQYEKDILKPGEIYCLECKRRVAKRMCLECWDAYCDECFRYTHHTGSLKVHKTMAYHKVKLGWMTIKSKDADEPDYYVNGATGHTQYEKPFELMSESEKKLYQDFLSHQNAANEYVKKIERLQYQLEEASFERDSILQDAMAAGFMGPSVSKALDKKKKRKLNLHGDEVGDQSDTIEEVQKKNKPGIMNWLTQGMADYRDTLLKPTERQRGSEKSEYMGKLLEEIKKDHAKKKAAESKL